MPLTALEDIHEAHHQQPTYSAAIKWIFEVTGLPKQRVARLLRTTRPTLDVWIDGGRIRDQNRQRVFAVHDVLKRATQHYGTPDQLVAWLDTPRGATGRTPAQLISAGEFDRARTLAVVTPSSGLAPIPAWVGRSVAEAFRVEEEYLPEALPPEEDIEHDIMSDGTGDEYDEWEAIQDT